MSFPNDFVWGAAAASYQVEGGARDDGKGPSVWDMMCRKEGAIWEGHSGDVACDHYHLWAQDVAIMKEIGLKGYRLSISWPRVIPAGTGKVNAKGLAFYDRLIDALLDAGIQPWVTLFHWDYPYELYCRGGWLSPESPDWFAEYAQVVVKKLGDRVRNWMTLNEPQCFIGLGMRDGLHAPGDKLGWAEVLRAAHHALLAHGRGVQVIRAHAKAAPRVGYAPVGMVRYPATDSRKDIDAARTDMFSITTKTQWNNTWWMDPIFKGEYPADGLEVFKDCLPAVGPRDMKTISQPLDFFGANIYNGQPIRAGRGGKPEIVKRPQGFPLTAFYWPVEPKALYWGPRFFHERYGKPIVITENGLSCTDWVALDGRVHDPLRIDFTARYLRELARASADGVPVQGYFHWSILDNFEWAEGYKQRFGMVYVDYPTGKRILKDSAYWYKQVIAANGANL